MSGTMLQAVEILGQGMAIIEDIAMSGTMLQAVEILGQGMASIFVVLGLIALVVAGFKKLDNRKKK